MKEQFFTVKEFASIVKMHYNSILRAIKSGRLNAFRINDGEKSSYRIPASEIERIGIIDLGKYIQRIIEDKMKNEE